RLRIRRVARVAQPAYRADRCRHLRSGSCGHWPWDSPYEGIGGPKGFWAVSYWSNGGLQDFRHEVSGCYEFTSRNAIYSRIRVCLDECPVMRGVELSHACRSGDSRSSWIIPGFQILT